MRSQSSLSIDAQSRPKRPNPMTATDRAGMPVISRAFYVPPESGSCYRRTCPDSASIAVSTSCALVDT